MKNVGFVVNERVERRWSMEAGQKSKKKGGLKARNESRNIAYEEPNSTGRRGRRNRESVRNREAALAPAVVALGGQGDPRRVLIWARILKMSSTSAANALTAKYELLRQRKEKLAKQKELEGAAGALAVSGGASSQGASHSGTASATPSVGDQKVGKALGGAERGNKRKSAHEETEPSTTVSAADLDRSIIAAVQASTSVTRTKAAALAPGVEEPVSKRARTGNLPSVDKKQSRPSFQEGLGNTREGIDGQDGGGMRASETPIDGKSVAGDDIRVAKRAARPWGDARLQGLLPSVHEALERVLSEVGLPKEEVERKVISALQELPEQVGFISLGLHLSTEPRLLCIQLRSHTPIWWVDTLAHFNRKHFACASNFRAETCPESATRERIFGESYATCNLARSLGEAKESCMEVIILVQGRVSTVAPRCCGQRRNRFLTRARPCFSFFSLPPLVIPIGLFLVALLLPLRLALPPLPPPNNNEWYLILSGT
jgi:hypothetical protein